MARRATKSPVVGRCGLRRRVSRCPRALTALKTHGARLVILSNGTRRAGRAFQRNRRPVARRTTSRSPLDEGAEAAFVAKVKALAPKYRTELLPQTRTPALTRNLTILAHSLSGEFCVPPAELAGRFETRIAPMVTLGAGDAGLVVGVAAG